MRTYIIRPVHKHSATTKLLIVDYLKKNNIRYHLMRPTEFLEEEIIDPQPDLYVQCGKEDIMIIKLKFPNIKIFK